ncbi:hypothetical protein B0H21DRAFT_758589 [Amylocystis lapponica]|nr:hypothetical protein B0H21DRAFT_758589 [Amylocystis lapponica]
MSSILEPASYAGSCNPPRRAKRPRALSVDYTESPLLEPTVTAKAVTRRARPRILPKAPAPGDTAEAEDSDEDEEEDDYEPSAAQSTPKRRGRKPGVLSRSARESLRKLNHSRIEKARRTKINETLSTLSTLVNEAEHQRGFSTGSAPVQDDTETAPAKRSGKGKVEEKEFKLDVLVKTVTYMQELISKVQALESSQCQNCSAKYVAAPLPDAAPPKSRQSSNTLDNGMEVDADVVHSTHDEDSYARDGEKGPAEADERASALLPPPSQSTSSPRLPSISSWLPHPYIDPSCLPILPGPRSSPTAQLPSPPPSGRIARANSVTNVPALALPAPAHPLPRARSPKARLVIPTGALAARDVPPLAWTPEDESAASLLLQMSSSPSSGPVETSPRMASRSNEGSKAKEAVAQQAQTPSSLLGLVKRR